MSGKDTLLNQEFVRGPYYPTCIITTVFTVLFFVFFLITLITWIIQTYVFNVYQLDIPFVWVSYSEDAILGIWAQTYQKFCTNLLIIYYVVFIIFSLLLASLTVVYMTAQRISDKDHTSFWAVMLRSNFNVLFRFYWILVYPVQVDLVLVIFGVTDIQFLLVALLVALFGISLYNLADWRMTKTYESSGSTLCIDFGCCVPVEDKPRHIPFYALIEFWLYFILALVYAVLLLVLAMVYTFVTAENHFYYLWAVFVFEFVQLVAITLILIFKNEFFAYFDKQNLRLSNDIALFFINSTVFILNTLVICIVSWARIGYIGCSNGCATSCP